MDVTVGEQPHRRSPDSRAAPASDEAVFRLIDVIKIYREADVETVALRGVDLVVASGEFVAVMGRSGSGKSTLLNLLAGLDRPSAGRVLFRGRDLAMADDAERSAIRGREIGIVYQDQNLAPMLSLLENVRLAAWLAGRPLEASGARAHLSRLALADREAHRPDQLSGGEQQRAALACVFAAAPHVLLADEITGELDSHTAGTVLEAVRDTHRTAGTTVVLVTHDPGVAGTADRVIELRDGRVAEH